MFTTELTRLSGGTYFCGPDFVRASDACSPVQVSIKDVDYRDPGIQSARNDKQKAVEKAAADLATAQGNAAAAVAEAEGKLRAANAQAALYSNPEWVKLEQAKLQLEAISRCAQAPNCRLVIGIDGQVLLNDQQ